MYTKMIILGCLCITLPVFAQDPIQPIQIKPPQIRIPQPKLPPIFPKPKILPTPAGGLPSKNRDIFHRSGLPASHQQQTQPEQLGKRPSLVPLPKFPNTPSQPIIRIPNQHPGIKPALNRYGNQISLQGNPTQTQIRTQMIPLRFRMIRLRKIQNNWLLFAGGVPLADFGKDKAAANQALRLLNFYRPSEYHVFGQGENRLKFFLTNGKAPIGKLYGLDATSFQADKLTVHQQGEEWLIKYRRKPLLSFSNQADANNALTIIRQHKFDLVYQLGEEAPVMTIFARNRFGTNPIRQYRR